MFERTGDNAKHGTQSSQLMNLQMSLLNAWTKARVEDFYQNNFLAYIDHLPPNSVET